MPIDFAGIAPQRKERLPVDPVEIFQKLKVSDPNINDLWLAQGDALRLWHAARDMKDVAIVLNTGAGKTLVGLLVAQSLVNETKGHVVYACSSIQLIEQTAKKAEGYGLAVTKYYRTTFDNDLYHRGNSPCITTYQALFNGKSIFFRDELSAIVFDDAHAAEHLIRDHYSLHINPQIIPDLYRSVVELFRDYFQKIGRLGSYTELASGRSPLLFFVPPFEIQRHFGELMRLLTSADLGERRETRFSWAYLRDNIDLCAVLISAATITFTPAFLPVRTLRYFSGKTRRMYLSATLAAEDGFTRTFGAPPDKLIAPETTAGECERLILVPFKSKIQGEDVAIAKALTRPLKTLVLVPTYNRATKWTDVALLPEREKVAEEVEKFKAANDIRKLLLAGRYDGIDLPGDTCRVMVLDDLPMGVGPLERFQWEYLKLSNSLRSTVASRIIQSFGRISRGMSDHGVIIITGQKLIDWMLIPKNLSMLPPFLQKQISLGMRLSSQVTKVDELRDAIERCLSRDKEWMSGYNNYMEASDAERSESDAGKRDQVAKAEAAFAVALWNRDYAAAAQCLSNALATTFDLSATTAGWHLLWLGRCYEFLGDSSRAGEMYGRAHAIERNIPPPRMEAWQEGGVQVPEQVLAVERQFSIDANGRILLPKNVHTDLAYLDGSGTVPQTEESLRALGQHLGLASNRPDNEYGTGPDVLWRSPKSPALCIELKTGKELAGEYQKRDIGQLSDHVQWVKNNSDAKRVIPIFVGPVTSATTRSNPPPDFRVVALEEFEQLAEKLTSALTDVSASAVPINLRQTILEVFRIRKLLWPGLFDGLRSTGLTKS